MNPDQVETIALQVERTARLFRREYNDWSVEFHRSIDSTSTEARRRIESGNVSSPFLIVAGHQNAGRGRQGRVWYSEPGSALLFTAALPLEKAAKRKSGLGEPLEKYPLTLFPLQIGIAVGLRLRLFGWDAKLKWPNDVLVGDCKVCGVLTEVVCGWLICGVGLNLSQSPDDFPADPDAKTPPASLAMMPQQDGHSEPPHQVIPSLLQSVVTVLESPWPPGRMIGWYQKWCVTIGKRVRYEQDGKQIEGTAQSVEEDGALVVETDEGKRVRVVNEVEVIETC